MAGSDEKEFDVEKFSRNIRETLTEDKSDANLDEYVEAYTELTKFLDSMGVVFSFVMSDVRSKLGILREFRNGKDAEHYRTVSIMMDHEIATGRVKIRSPPNGCRTLLRLHRALAFILRLLEDLLKSKPDDKVSDVVWSAYNDTLAPYHKWIIRKAVGIAMVAVPSRNQLLHRFGNEQTAGGFINKIVGSGKPLYEVVEAMYVKNDLLKLP